MPEKVTQGFIDYSGERSRTQYYVATGVGDDLSVPLADADAVHDGMAVITLCNFTDQLISRVVQSSAPVIPVDQQGQRELILWVQYADDVTGNFGSMSIPGPDLELLAQANTDEVDIVSNVTAAAFVVILEANLVSPDDNAISVTRMRILGRRA